MEIEVDIQLEDGELVIELVDADSLVVIGRGTLDLDELKEALDDYDSTSRP